ncbi:hypothetical protein [Marinicrinis sediminis]|uniref:Uncharacterized protein n=1 Tax=Marinicrinis sediminis TaxID=1652465 RepID=A0ABW5RDS6_9BACL
MSLVVFFTLAWLAVFYLYGLNKHWTVIENTFIFLLVLVLHINFTWIAGEELKWFTVTEHPMTYAAYLIQRTILIPTVFVIVLNWIASASSWSRKLWTIAGSLLLLLVIQWISTAYELLRYEQWNTGYDLLYLVLLMSLVMILHRGYQTWIPKETEGIK